jgi:hypothetical protein
MLAILDPRYSSDIQILRFNLPRSSNLPFYLLAWSQLQIYSHNCRKTCKANLSPRTAFSITLPPIFCSFCSFFRTEKEDLDYLTHISASIEKSIVHRPEESFLLGLEEIRYVYYTEADQILFFSDMDTLQAITAASNATSIILGRRRYKQSLKFPYDYKRVLARGPGCGREGYYIAGTSGILQD